MPIINKKGHVGQEKIIMTVIVSVVRDIKVML